MDLVKYFARRGSSIKKPSAYKKVAKVLHTLSLRERCRKVRWDDYGSVWKAGERIGGVERYRRAHNLMRKEALAKLERDDVYTLHKPVRKHFRRCSYIAAHISDL